MRFGRTCWIGIAAGWLLAAATLRTIAAEGQIELGSRYIDPVNGFSLHPPAGADRVREFSPARLVSWSQRDPKTGAIAWTLTVRHEPAAEGAAIAELAKELPQRLAGRDDCQLDSAEPGKLLNRDCLHVRMQRGQTARRWQYEVWLPAGDKHLLVLAIQGPLDIKERLESILRQVAATARLIDPKAAEAARKENLQRGKALLSQLTPEKLSATMKVEPRWYLYTRHGADIGFMYTAAAAARDLNVDGWQVTTVARLEVRSGQATAIRRNLFISADRAREHWSETAEVRQGARPPRKMTEDGRREGPAISCRIAEGAKARTNQKPMPPLTAEHYLPRALSIFLPRLADLSRTAAYAFATYTTAANDFDMRTFEVIAPETIILGTRAAEAVRADDQMAADAEPVMLWLSPDGCLLRMRTADGVTMDLSTREAVVRRYPDAESLIAAK